MKRARTTSAGSSRSPRSGTRFTNLPPNVLREIGSHLPYTNLNRGRALSQLRNAFNSAVQQRQTNIATGLERLVAEVRVLFGLDWPFFARHAGSNKAHKVPGTNFRITVSKPWKGPNNTYKSNIQIEGSVSVGNQKTKVMGHGHLDAYGLADLSTRFELARLAKPSNSTNFGRISTSKKPTLELEGAVNLYFRRGQQPKANLSQGSFSRIPVSPNKEGLWHLRQVDRVLQQLGFAVTIRYF